MDRNSPFFSKLKVKDRDSKRLIINVDIIKAVVVVVVVVVVKR